LEKLARFLLLYWVKHLKKSGTKRNREMNLLMTLTEALQSTGEMDRDSDAILGLCNPSQTTSGSKRYSPTYSAYLRRRDRIRRAA